MIKKYARLFRLKHYVKNLLIFTPLFFNGSLFAEYIFHKTFLSFLSFSVMASIIYIINDICDVEADRKNPAKQKRPIASGEVSISSARNACIALGILSLLLLLASSPADTVMTLTAYLSYMLLNLYYSVGKAKEIPILDVFILAGGFVLRIIFGASVSGISISNWLYLVVWMGALYFGLGKRRNEGISKYASRNVLAFYPHRFLDKCMNICLTSMFVFYSLWCSEPDKRRGIPLILSVPLLLAILMKYSLDIEQDGADGDPVETVFHDKTLLLLCIAYTGLLFLCYYSRPMSLS